MPRQITTQAVVCYIKPAGENNSSVCLLTQRDGIVFATMYGGPKSRLRSLVSAWNSGTAYLSQPRKGGALKIYDFDVREYHLSFRESLYKTYAASLAAEMAIKTKCAGSPPGCWTLVSGFLDGLERCRTDSQCGAGLLRFLWRYLGLLGICPDASCCRRCGAGFSAGDTDGAAPRIHGGAFFCPEENGFVCRDCSAGTGGTAETAGADPLYLGAEEMRYLGAVSALPPAEARRIPLSADAARRIRTLVFSLAESACGTKLKSIEAGAGIL